MQFTQILPPRAEVDCDSANSHRKRLHNRTYMTRFDIVLRYWPASLGTLAHRAMLRCGRLACVRIYDALGGTCSRRLSPRMIRLEKCSSSSQEPTPTTSSRDLYAGELGASEIERTRTKRRASLSAFLHPRSRFISHPLSVRERILGEHRCLYIYAWRVEG